MLNTNLNSAKTAKNDEFYTQLADVKKELDHYRQYFSDKVIYCNCDNPAYSNFWRYFADNFTAFGLKKLIATYHAANGTAYKTELTRAVDGDGQVTVGDAVKTALTANGDFRSPECSALLQEADIVVTNPPFSLFRAYIAQLVATDKRFIILGTINAVTYRELLPLLMADKVWLGYKMGAMRFRLPDSTPAATKNVEVVDGLKYQSLGNITWYTNLPTTKRTEKLVLHKHYNPEEFPTYDNYDAINVNRVLDIPMDYQGIMGVPITFMAKYNPDQFEILGDNGYHDGGTTYSAINYLNGKLTYRRILIRHRQKGQA